MPRRLRGEGEGGTKRGRGALAELLFSSTSLALFGTTDFLYPGLIWYKINKR
jgi:hypothetical protein